MNYAISSLPNGPPVEPPAAALEDLLRQVALGDTQAFESLYARVSGPVYGIARRVLRDPAQAEEVAQEVLLWVWREASRFDQAQGSAMTWIMTIAHRRAVDRVRSEESTRARGQRAAQRDVAPAYDEVSEDVLTRLDREAVRQALSALTPMQRESVTMAYYDGHTYREVAELLQIPLGTVKTRIRDGLIRMRDSLAVTA
jgi:RNA polymerase sigma-70 factor (ECF subfamily)